MPGSNYDHTRPEKTCSFYRNTRHRAASPADIDSRASAVAKVTITRLLDRPLIGPDIHPSIGENIQGPSLIKVPDWLPNKMGNYYLYFADHKGLYIRLAYADSITGPWQIHEPGSLQIEDSILRLHGRRSRRRG